MITRYKVTLVLEDKADEKGEALVGFAHGIKIENADTGEEVSDPETLKDTPALYGLMQACKTFYAMHEKGEMKKERKKRKVYVPTRDQLGHTLKYRELKKRGK